MFLRSKLLQVTSILVILTLLFSGFSMQPALAQGKDGLKREVNPQTGKVSFLGPENGSLLSASQALGISPFSPLADPALALAKRFGGEFGLQSPERDLSQMKTQRVEGGRIMARYQQSYQGVPVMGGELIVNTNDSGDLYSMNGEVSPDLSLSIQPAIDSEQAKQTALRAVAKWNQKTSEDFLVSEPQLWIFDESLLRPSTRPAELVWRMEVTPKYIGLPVRELVLVNAQRGGISLYFNQIDTSWSSSHTNSGVQDAQPTPAPASTETTPTETPEPVVTPIPTEETKLNEDTSASNALTGEIGPFAVTTWYVATTGNDTNSCSSAGSPCATINGAIGKAAAGDTIEVAIGTYTHTGTSISVVNIFKSITLLGGWDAGFITQSGTSIVDGQGLRPGIGVSGEPVVIDHFTIQNGFANHVNFSGGAGIGNSGTLLLSNSIVRGNESELTGGGIWNRGTLTLNKSVISGNSTGYGSTGGGGGGGIENNGGTVTLNDSTVSGNIMRGGFSGSGIHSFGNLILNNSTVANNLSAAAIHSDGFGTITLNNSTVSGNPLGGIYKQDGTLIINNGTVSNNGYGISLGAVAITLRNSLIAANTNFDCFETFGPIVSSGYNLIGSNSNCTFTPTTGDLVGTSANPINPRLTPLQDNGGSTLTQALMMGSPAIGAGNPAVPGSGGNACLATDQRGETRPVDGRCDIGAYEGVSSWTIPYRVSTYTANRSSSLPGTLVCDETDPICSLGDSDAKSSHIYAIGTYNLYAAQHSRNSIDNHGVPIISSVHYCESTGCPYDNAGWTGTQMVYGDRFGYPLADDVVAHELTHGVTQYESNLYYYYQSGAINESFSDLWGEYYDQTNGLGKDIPTVRWQLGEDVSGLLPIRDMSNPPAYGDPDKMSSPNYYEGEEDNGGVHFNSGVNNKAVYLMVDGGTFNGKTVSPLGWVKTAAVYYEANTSLLSSGADYFDLYYALQQACTNLIGQKGITAADCVEVKDAVDAVEMNAQPSPNFNTDAPFCDVGSPLSTILSDDLESGTGNWTFTNGATPRWQVDSPDLGPYAQSGLHSLYADDYPDVVTDASARLKSILVQNNTYLRFAQAYDFESGYLTGNPTFYNFDGGVLEYSTNNGATWLDAGSLIDVNGYKGTIATGWNNPLSARSGFVGTSHGYISTRLNLDSLVGQTVSFRWRMGLDSAGYSLGWWVDDVRVYQCPAQETTPPVVSSIARAGSKKTSAARVDFIATFSESVNGVSESDFSLHATGNISGAAISSVTGSGATYTVTVNTGTKNGTLRLDVPASATIADLAGNSLASLPFETGETYTIVKTNGSDTTGVFRPINGLLYLKNSNDTGFADAALNYGLPGDYPVVGDWDGDGTVTIGIYRQGYFYLKNANTLGFADIVFPFGQPGDQPIAGDWDGDGEDTIGVFNLSTGHFLLRNSNTEGSAEMDFYLGNPGDIGIAGDWNGDGKDTTGVFRPSNGVIFLKDKNESGFADYALNYGLPGDKPIMGDWDNNGIDTIGIYRNGSFYLRNENTNGFAEIIFGLGNPGDVPIAGNWDNLP